MNTKSAQKQAIKNPKYWATGVESKVSGILTQVQQHFEENHPLRVLLTRHCDELGAYIHDGTIPDRIVEITVAEGKLDARTALIHEEQVA